MVRFLVALFFCLVTTNSFAEAVLYIGTKEGRLLTASGESATTTPSFSPQKIVGFFGYGPIRLNDRCLEAQKNDAAIKWRPCISGDPSQVWRLRNEQLANLAGVCASHGGSDSPTQVPVRAAECSRVGEQTWVSYGRIPSQRVLRDTDPELRSEIEEFLMRATAGERLRLTDDKADQVPAKVLLWDQSLIAADRKNLVYGPL